MARIELKTDQIPPTDVFLPKDERNLTRTITLKPWGLKASHLPFESCYIDRVNGFAIISLRGRTYPISFQGVEHFELQVLPKRTSSRKK